MTMPGWWGSLEPRTRRITRALIAWVITGLLSAGWGVLTAHHAGSLGPHVAQYSTTLNEEITFDMGPLGSLIVDSPLPLHLGVLVQVGQIPQELAPGSPLDSGDGAVAALTSDLAAYTQFFSSPGEAIDAAARGLITDATSRAFLLWSILLTGILLGRLAAHGVLRAAAVSAWRRPGVAPVVIVLAVVGAVVSIAPATEGSAGAGRTSRVLANTPLQDARITGRLGDLIDHYGQVVLDEIEKNNDFYDAVARNLDEKFEADGAVTGPVGPLLGMPGVGPSDDPDDAADQGEAGSAPASEPARMPAGDLVTMVVVSDLHCNVGMGRIAGKVADAVEADVILNLGDNVLGGTSVEGFCVDSFAADFGSRPVVAANGNHDSDVTAQQQRAHGWHVLDGEVVEVAGVRFLGDDDPTLTSLGAPTRLIGPENIEERGHRLAREACDLQAQGRGADMLLMHNHRATEEALDTGCIGYAFSGHFHRRIGPWQRGLGVQYLHTSTAGAVLNKPTIGPLNGPAGISVLIWEEQTRRPVAMRVVRAMPDTGVELSPWYAYPEPPDHPVHLDWPTPQEAPWP